MEKYLGLEQLYVLGTNCVDNGPRQGLEKFLRAASSTPDTVLHYEFMQVAYTCETPPPATCAKEVCTIQPLYAGSLVHACLWVA